ncbi:hypothetical protein N7495_007795 [Penicillium taxi]|uniref:uncharacterized protein n=1 Tax=Penicillium taxi TaxID=168475 RepID=UPI0025450A66|nr:uncharacterized protein N7495_007795 [Penicillium taxi]KAJ5887754.1 hypothetical protein N7495_007795 [Penicillium taxi]
MPPIRQYNASPISPVSGPGGYAPDAMYGADPAYAAPDTRSANGGHGPGNPTYNLRSGPPGPPGPSSRSRPPHGPSNSQPRSMRPPGPPGPMNGRPPNGGPRGPDPRRPYPPGAMPPQKRSRAPRNQPRPGENYDNPFPTVAPRDPRDRRGPDPRGLENGMAAMDINGNGRMPPRPHTANGQRQGMRPPPPRGPPPVRGRGGQYSGPGRPPVRPDQQDRSYTDPNFTGMHPAASRPHPSRSATMPSQTREYTGPAAYGDFEYQQNSMDHTPSTRSDTTGSRRYPMPRPGNDMDSGLMVSHSDVNNRVSYAPREFLDSYYESGPDEDPDMPNFDAIPESGPVDEMGLDTHTIQTSSSPPSSSGGQYAAFSPTSGNSSLAHSKSQPNLRKGSVPNQFEHAGFQFDIPSEMHPGQAGYVPQGYEAHGYEQGSPYDQVNPYAGHVQDPYAINQPVHEFEQAQIPDPQQSPDTLSSHPTPFRLGHDPSGKPAPVRQYTGAPNPAPAQSAPQPQPPTGPDSTPVTQQEVERLQQKARANPADHKTSLLLAKKMVEAADVLVTNNARLDAKMKVKAREKYILDAYKIVKKLVSAGVPDAQFYLADCYGEGQLGLEADPKEAYSLYHSAAKAGHAQSAYRVAVCCEIGQEEGGGTRRDPMKSVQWYKRAAALGDTPAMYKMGMINLKGLLGQTKNPREGVSWLKRAAERADEENPHALHELALMYQTATGNDTIVQDEAYACELFHQAADLGYKFSQFRLGTAYEYGLMGCPVDNRMSIIWYTRAAAQGEHQSELALSGWYLTGSEGILQQNDTEAYLWARKAATAGLAKAEYAMGYFTEVGIGATANLDDAKRWYWRAAGRRTYYMILDMRNN